MLFLREMHVVEDVVLTEAVVPDALAAVTELQIRVVGIRAAADGALVAIALLLGLLGLLLLGLTELDGLAGVLVFGALLQVVDLRPDEHGEVQQGHDGQHYTGPVVGADGLDDVEGEGKEQQTVDEKCEKCGSEMVMKVGPYGKYLECKECKNRKKYIRSTGVKCPKCGEGTIIEKKSKYGKIFFGCNRYPECSYALWDEPTGNKCPECGELLVKKVTKNGNFEVCSSRTCSFKHPLEDVKESEKPE